MLRVCREACEDATEGFPEDPIVAPSAAPITRKTDVSGRKEWPESDDERQNGEAYGDRAAATSDGMSDRQRHVGQPAPARPSSSS